MIHLSKCTRSDESVEWIEISTRDFITPGFCNIYSFPSERCRYIPHQDSLHLSLASQFSSLHSFPDYSLLRQRNWWSGNGLPAPWRVWVPLILACHILANLAFKLCVRLHKKYVKLSVFSPWFRVSEPEKCTRKTMIPWVDIILAKEGLCNLVCVCVCLDLCFYNLLPLMMNRE